MAEKTKEVGIRLSVKDADKVKAALQATGKDGAAALKAIEDAGRRAGPGLTKLSESIMRTKEYARDFASEAARSFLGPVVAIGTAAGAIDVLRDSLEQVSKVAELGDLADRIGLNITKLQGLQATFKESGNDVEELNGALQTFGVNLQKALSQGGPLKDIFDLNKVKITGDTLTDLKNYADLVKNAGNEQQRLLLVTTAFGKGSKELVDLLLQGGAALGYSADEAERLGVGMSNLDAENAREVVKELAQVNLKLDATKEKLGLLVAPTQIAAMKDLVEEFKQWEGILTAISKLDFSKLFYIKQYSGTTGVKDFLGQLFQTPDQSTPNSSGSPDDRDRRAPISLTVHGGTPTQLPVAPDHAAEQQTKRIQDVNNALALQTQNLFETNRQQEINNALARAQIAQDDPRAALVRQLAGDYYDQKQAIDAVNQATAFLASTGESVFEGLIDGTKSWTDVLGDTVKTLEKAVLQAALLGQGPLSGILGTQGDKAGGTGGVLGSLFSGIVQAFTHKSAKGDAFIGSRDLHSYVNTIARGPTPFAFAKGAGIMGEVPGSPGEAILPLLRDSKGRLGVSGPGGGCAAPQIEVSVQIVRMAGSGQDSLTSTQQGSKLALKAMVYDAVADGIATPGNPIHKAIKTTFGARPQLTGR